MIRRPPRSPLSPSTTLFRSGGAAAAADSTSPASPVMDSPPPSDPALTDPAQRYNLLVKLYRADLGKDTPDRKSTRLNSSHQIISYAVFCLKKKKHEIVSGRH